jgi:hypothetical protein
MADTDDTFMTVKQFAEKHKGLMSLDAIGDATRRYLRGDLRNGLPCIRLGEGRGRIYIPANALSLLREQQAAALREQQVEQFRR